MAGRVDVFDFVAVSNAELSANRGIGLPELRDQTLLLVVSAARGRLTPVRLDKETGGDLQFEAGKLLLDGEQGGELIPGIIGNSKWRDADPL